MRLSMLQPGASSRLNMLMLADYSGGFRDQSVRIAIEAVGKCSHLEWFGHDVMLAREAEEAAEYRADRHVVDVVYHQRVQR